VLFPLLTEKLAPRNADRQQDAGGTLANAVDENAHNGDQSILRTPHAAFISGWESVGEVVLVDQSPLGRTPRSNPAVYIGAFEAIRELFAQTEAAKQHGLNASAFSFNSGQGQCEKCRGAGFEKIEMQFLSDVFIRCPDCDGRRYREHILEVKLESALRVESSNGSKTPHFLSLAPNAQPTRWSIADLLDATIDEVLEFLRGLPESRPRDRALSTLKLLQDVGLGYLRAGQPINTLSGGESQRLKLVSHLAQSIQPVAIAGTGLPPNDSALRTPHSALTKFFIFDEPTTGLHFDDVRVLLEVFQRLVDEGHSLLVIEHNLELIRCADWIIDLGPEAGDAGGEVVVAGTPAQVTENWESLTGAALRDRLSHRVNERGAKHTVP
jgi:excinuclease ABC subunit A